MNKDKIVVGIGEVLWDNLPDGMVVGGAPANFAFHASRYGHRSFIVSSVGSDEKGTALLHELSEKGVECAVSRVDKPTGEVEVCLDSQKNAIYDIKKDVAWDVIPYTDDVQRLSRMCDAVCFGTLAQRSSHSQSTIYRFIDGMKNSSYKIFDANLRQHYYSEHIISESLKRCNVLKVNDEELAVVSALYGIDTKDVRFACVTLVERFVIDILILTCGVNGSYVFTSSNCSFIPTPPVSVVDTVGAGDSFTAVFVSALLDGYSVSDAHKIAVSLSAYVCEHNGAMVAWDKTIMRA